MLLQVVIKKTKQNKNKEDDEKEIQEVAAGLAAAKGISVDAAKLAV